MFQHVILYFLLFQKVCKRSSFRSAACWHRSSLIFGQVYLTAWLAKVRNDTPQLVFLIGNMTCSMSGVSACCEEEP